MMQLKDKLDFSFLASKKATINKIVFTLLKFIAICAVMTAFFYVSRMLKLFSMMDHVPVSVVIIFFGMTLLLSAISCTVGLMKTLFTSADNKILITFPVETNMIYMSKLIMYYIFELVKFASIVVPMFIGYGIVSSVNPVYYVWAVLSVFPLSALPVLAGALLSIPALYVYRFFKRNSSVATCSFVVIVVLAVWGVTKLINLIPENINLINSWGQVYFWKVQDVLNAANSGMKISGILVRLVTGNESGVSFTLFTTDTLVRLGILWGSIIVLTALNFLLSRPLFFRMMSKSFEFEKKRSRRELPNVKRSPMWSRIRKEFAVCLRSDDVIYNFLAVYIAVPLLILLLNRIFAAMDTRLKGQMMVYAFNMLIILLPLMSSNSIVATLFSKEGSAGYMRKTEPSDYVLPLTSKLVFNLVASAVSIFASCMIFSVFAKINVWQTILVFLSLTGMQYGSIFFASTLDLMNPQNAQYSLVGNDINNPNETKTTVMAFISAGIYAIYSYKLFSEGIGSACVKLFLIGLAFFGAWLLLYVRKIQIYYSEK